MHLKFKPTIQLLVFSFVTLFAQHCFSQSLEFKREISGYEQKPEKINFVFPAAIAVNDVTGNVYVGDYGTSQVQKFTSSGKFISKFSLGTDIHFGVYGSVGSIATDISGNLYVIDESNDEVKKYNAADELVSSFPYTTTSAYSMVKDIAVAPTGNYFIVESECSCVKKYGPDGSYKMKWGTEGTGNGQLYLPGRLATDAAGNIYVLDMQRIQKFKEDGTFISSFGLSIIDDYIQEIADLTIDAAGKIYIIYKGYPDYDKQVYSTVVKAFDPNGNLLHTWNQISTEEVGNHDFPRITISKSGTLFELWNRRVHAYKTDGTFITRWGSQAMNGQFYAPGAVAIDSKQNVYVADQGNWRIQKFDRDGKFIQSWPYTYASRIAIDHQDHVFLVDQDYNYNVTKYTSDGVLLVKWGTEGTGDGQFKNPSDVAVDADGNVYVVDAGNYRVQKFTNDGLFISTLTTTRPQLYQGYQSARWITIDQDGFIYIAHAGNFTIQKYSSNWEFQLEWSSLGGEDEHATYGRMAGLCTDTLGNIYVTDRYGVRLFSNTGTLISTWNEIGCGYNQANDPQGIAVDDSGTVYLADRSNNRILASNTVPELPDVPVVTPTFVKGSSGVELQINVFPNPSSGSLTVTSSSVIETITLTNSIGQTQIVSDGNQISTTFKGLVLVEVQTDLGREVKKVIIQ